MNKFAVESAVNKIDWWHRINLGNGIVTQGKVDPLETLKLLKLPDLKNKTVLDVGAWDGFYSFEVEKMGAKEVLATDYYCWSGPGWGTKDGFNLARKTLNSTVRDMEIDASEISVETVGTFDVVLFLGVLYHLYDFYRVLESLYNVTNEVLILETHVDFVDIKRPAIAFYEGKVLDNDETNVWGPNPTAIKAILREIGFSNIEMIYPSNPKLYYSPPYRFFRALKHKIKSNRQFFYTFRQGRVVFHAWK